MISLHEAVIKLLEAGYGYESAAAVASELYKRCGYAASTRFDYAITVAQSDPNDGEFWDRAVTRALNGASEVATHLNNRVPIPTPPVTVVSPFSKKKK